MNSDKTEGPMRKLNQVYDEMRANGILCDAEVICSDEARFQVHRILLSAHSGYFRELYTKWSRPEQHNTARLDLICGDDMRELLNFVYTHQLELTAQNVTRLLHAADYLNMQEVHVRCVDFLVRNVSAANCVSMRQFARDHYLALLEKSAQLFLLRNFPAVAEVSEEILYLTVDELVPLLASDQLNVRHENIVWQFVLRWVDHDKENRLPHLVSLLKCIRLGLMDVTYFLENVKCHPYVVGNDSCRPVVIDTLKVLMDVETIAQRDGAVQTPECARPRIPHEVLFAIGGWSGGSPTNAVETYDTRADRWIRVEEVDPAGPRAYHGTAVIGYDIYVVGGFDGMENFNSCRCFNAAAKTWREIAPMHERRCYVSVVVVDDIVYAMGGYNGHHRQNSAEKYDYLTNQWTTIAPMHVQRSDASAAVLDGKIYITGGFDGRECLASAECYDPSTNVWTLLPPMRSRRSGVSSIAYHGCIYVLGGFNGGSRMASVEKYSPAGEQWTEVPDMYTTRSNFAIEVIDDMVFAIGGFNGINTIHQVECYEERPNEWYEATDMNVFRSALAACVVSDLPNLNDYIHQNRHMLMEEKRQKLLALQQNSDQNAITEANPAVQDIQAAIQEVNNAVLNNNDDEHMDQQEA